MRLCVFVFVDQCVAFPIFGKFVLCILVLLIHLNDSLFDFFPVAQLTVINLVLSKHCNAMCAAYCTYIHSAVTWVVSLRLLTIVIAVNCQCTNQHCQFTDTVSVTTQILAVYYRTGTTTMAIDSYTQVCTVRISALCSGHTRNILLKVSLFTESGKCNLEHLIT